MEVSCTRKLKKGRSQRGVRLLGSRTWATEVCGSCLPKGLVRREFSSGKVELEEMMGLCDNVPDCSLASVVFDSGIVIKLPLPTTMFFHSDNVKWYLFKNKFQLCKMSYP